MYIKLAIIIIFALTLIIAAPAVAKAASTVTCLGDSVTAGVPYTNTDKTYPAKLEVLLDENFGNEAYNVINRGVSGYRADQILAALTSEGWLAEDNPSLVLLMAGGNDIAGANPSNIVEVVDQTVSEMQQIVDAVESHTNPDGSHPRIIVSTFIPNLLLGPLGSLAIEYYNSILESDLTNIDLLIKSNWNGFYDSETGSAKASLMADSTHPNEAGYTLMAGNWYEAVIIFPPDPDPDPTPPLPDEPNPKIIATSGPGEITRMQIYDRHGYVESREIGSLFPDSYQGGAGVVPIDSTNSGFRDHVVIFAQSNGGPQARVFSVEYPGELSFAGQMFVFDETIRDGLSIVAGDFDGDGFDDDIAACLTGKTDPLVRIYRDIRGVDNWELIVKFTAGFGAVGCNLGTFQYDDGADELLVTPYQGEASPEVYIYSAGGSLKKEFTAYGAGVINGLIASGINDRIYTTPNNGTSHVRSFDRNGDPMNFWWAYGENVKGDFKNIPGDIDLDGKDEILISPVGSNGSQILSFETTGYWRSWPNFFAFGDKSLRNGVGIAVIEKYYTP